MKTVTNYFVQQGSSGNIRIGNEDAWIVIAETWRGSQIVGTRYVSTHNTKSEAEAACAVLRNTR